MATIWAGAIHPQGPVCELVSRLTQTPRRPIRLAGGRAVGVIRRRTGARSSRGPGEVRRAAQSQRQGRFLQPCKPPGGGGGGLIWGGLILDFFSGSGRSKPGPGK